MLATEHLLRPGLNYTGEKNHTGLENQVIFDLATSSLRSSKLEKKAMKARGREAQPNVALCCRAVHLHSEDGHAVNGP